MQSSVVVLSVIGSVWEKNGDKKGYTKKCNGMDSGLGLRPKFLENFFVVFSSMT